VLESERVSLSVTEVGRHLLGRSSEATLRIEHSTIHRRHAYLVLTEDRASVEIEDLGGSNGTAVNGVRVEHAPLSDGDRLSLGEVQVRIRLIRG